MKKSDAQIEVQIGGVRLKWERLAIKRDRLVDMPLVHQGRTQIEVNPRILRPQPPGFAKVRDGRVGLTAEVQRGTKVANGLEVMGADAQSLAELGDRALQLPLIGERRAHEIMQLRAPSGVLQ